MKVSKKQSVFLIINISNNMPFPISCIVTYLTTSYRTLKRSSYYILGQDFFSRVAVKFPPSSLVCLKSGMDRVYVYLKNIHFFSTSPFQALCVAWVLFGYFSMKNIFTYNIICYWTFKLIFFSIQVTLRITIKWHQEIDVITGQL